MPGAIKRLARAATKAGLAELIYRTGGLSLFSRARRAAAGATVHVVTFHRVVDDLRSLDDEVIRPLCISTPSFARFVELGRRRFEVLPLTVAAEVLAGKRPLGREALVITFDDAYRDVWLRAAPVLRRLGVPATVFVPTGLVDTERPLLHDRLHALLVRARKGRLSLAGAPAPKLLRLAIARAETVLYRRGALEALSLLIAALPAGSLTRLGDALADLVGEPTLRGDGGQLVMSSDELRGCVELGLSLGAHTVDHVVLTHEPGARVQRELERPRRDLEAITGAPCRAFAYCNGLLGPSLVSAVRAAGYTVAVTTRSQPNHPGCDLLTLGRRVLWEAHAHGLTGRFSEPVAAAHLHDLFGGLGLSRAIEGTSGADARWRQSA